MLIKSQPFSAKDFGAIFRLFSGRYFVNTCPKTGEKWHPKAKAENDCDLISMSLTSQPIHP